MAVPGLNGDVVYVGRLVQAQRLIALGDDAGAANDRIVDHHGVGKHEDAEVSAVVRAGHGIEGRRDVVDGVAGRQLRATQFEDELLECCGLSSLGLVGFRMLTGRIGGIGHGHSLPGGSVTVVPEAPFRHDPTYRPIIGVAKGVFGGLGIRFDIVGEENIPLEGGALLAMNHTSFLDFALGGMPAYLRGKRLVRYMAKDAVFKHRLGGPLMRGMRHIPVDREHGSQSFRDAVTYLKAGELVGIFPEATMSRAMDIKEIKTGAVRIAMAAKVPLIPMCILGGARMLSYGHKDFSRGTVVAITVGEAMHPTRGQDAEELTVELQTRMRDLLDQTVARYPYEGSPWWIPARLGGSAPTLEQAEVLDQQARERRAAKKAAKGVKKK